MPTESISLDELTSALKTAVADGVKSLHDNAHNGLESSFSSAEKILEKKLSSDNPKVEIPTISAKKGGNYANLPVHEKQLANILLRRDAFFGMEAVKQVEKSYKKDFDASSSGSGLEYIPTNLQTRLFEDLELADYISFVNKKPNETIQKQELYSDYKAWFASMTEIKQLKEKKAFKDKTKTEQQAELDKLFFEKVFAKEQDKML